MTNCRSRQITVFHPHPRIMPTRKMSLVENQKLKEFLLIIFFSLILIFSTCTKKREFQTEKIDGVEVAVNSGGPMTTENLIQLKKLFAIGREGDENYIFHQPAFIGTDSGQNIIVLDRGNFRILKFDSTGRFLAAFGNQGSGPGEFRQPFAGCVDRRNCRIVIFDQQNLRFEIFDTDGNFIKSVGLLPVSMVRQLECDAAGNLFVLLTEINLNAGEGEIAGKVLKLVQFSREFKPQKTIFESEKLTPGEYQFNWNQRECMALDSNGHIYLPAPEREQYEINVFDANGKHLKKIIRQVRLRAFNPEQIARNKKANEMREKMLGYSSRVPTHFPPVRRFILDQSDRLWVWAMTDAGASLDVFDPQGQYVFQLKHKGIHAYSHIKENRLYKFSLQNDFWQLEVYQIIDREKHGYSGSQRNYRQAK